MRRFLLRFCVLLVTAVVSLTTIAAQDTIPPTSIDPKLLEWENARIPKEYTIADISITGIRHLDTAIVLSIASLQPGDKFMHPGEDIFARSIAGLWRQKLFLNVQIYITKVVEDRVSIEINVVERARLGNIKFAGIKKTDQEELRSEEHTSELQSQSNLVCRLRLEKKNKNIINLDSNSKKRVPPLLPLCTN